MGFTHVQGGPCRSCVFGLRIKLQSLSSFGSGLQAVADLAS